VSFACNLGGFEQMFWKLNWKNIWVIGNQQIVLTSWFSFPNFLCEKFGDLFNLEP
jgi:hypothetical protein